MAWKQEIIAEKSETLFSNCSACAWRNWPKICKKMTCTYDCINVHWVMKNHQIDDPLHSAYYLVRDVGTDATDVITKFCVDQIQKLH